MFMRIAFFTLGCKVNQYETEVLASSFSSNGFDVVGIDDEADVYVINSCTVTSSGDKKTRQAIRKFKRNNPNSIVALTGCFPQAFENEAISILEADVITGSYNRANLVSAVKKCLATNSRVVDITPHQKNEEFEKMTTTGFLDRTRAFIKIEDGCDRYCSYCIIPTARGPIRSKSLDDLKKEIVSLGNSGYKEVVLVGINLSSYGKDLGLRLIDAVELACSIDEIQRVRLGSLEPELITDSDFEKMATFEKFCPQFHLSLQSGCDETLLRMNRHYDTNTYRNIVKKIRSTFDNPSITTDIMVGFPMETQAEFDASLSFAKEIGFSLAHVFCYSRREGTKAFSMKGQILESVKQKRSKLLIEVTNQTRLDFLKSQIGTVQSVLFETKKTPYGYEGYSKNYTPIFVKTKNNLSCEIFNVIIKDVENNHCIGEIVK
jgi:threonylcarbamoyladenosine tRNA methylthiotransferase MtaB